MVRTNLSGIGEGGGSSRRREPSRSLTTEVGYEVASRPEAGVRSGRSREGRSGRVLVRRPKRLSDTSLRSGWVLSSAWLARGVDREVGAAGGAAKLVRACGGCLGARRRKGVED